ncbi:hypothetical protein [Thermoflavimicrobium dichotomicum]|uniref:Uncharacterized protein n=1 Tax=Thermoflavimicrobium dichotomicum TaxID=46223 RepID=A0A1I3U4D9_9BACL|nr:hypothetical protein [Thermoflavimicrobium dichotomicum]SFJ76661.1 hypothetical protein SAMN05421852_1216 [Thermoflavimicrobium dichotomicum]
MSKRLSIRQKQWFLIAHIVFFTAWLGGALCMFLLGLWAIMNGQKHDLAQTYTLIHLIDDTLIKFPAIGTLVTGFILSIWTHWGVTRYYWVIIKEVLTILIILMGIFFLSDWLSEVVAIAEKHGASALGYQEFIMRRNQLLVAGFFNILAMVSMVIISVIKPWGKRKGEHSTAPARS